MLSPNIIQNIIQIRTFVTLVYMYACMFTSLRHDPPRLAHSFMYLWACQNCKSDFLFFNVVPALFLLALVSLHFCDCKILHVMLYDFPLVLPLPATLGILLPILSTPASCTLPAHFSHNLQPPYPPPHQAEVYSFSKKGH